MGSPIRAPALPTEGAARNAHHIALAIIRDLAKRRRPRNPPIHDPASPLTEGLVRADGTQQLEKFAMRLLASAVVIATGSLLAVAQAASSGCPPAGSPLSHTQSIEQNPTVPATIGGCGTGAYKLHQYKKHMKEFEDRQQMIGPKATGSGENL